MRLSALPIAASPGTVRVRFGLDLRLPLLRNAGVFVLRLSEAEFGKGEEHVAGLRMLLHATGRAEIADRLLWQRS